MESLLRQDLPLRKEFSKKKKNKKKTYVQSTPKVALRVNPVLQMDLTYRFQINKPLLRVVMCQAWNWALGI